MTKVTVTYNKNNYISTAKALGIIFMVIGHSQCPTLLHNIIYMFHMPLFFFCSGYFFHKLNEKEAILPFIKKKIKGLYLPYIKWSIAFLLLHNIFFSLNIYNDQFGYLGGSHYYGWQEFLCKLIKVTFTMDDHEYLLGGFWFIKILFLDAIFIGVSSLFIKHEKISKNMIIIFSLVLCTILLRYRHINNIFIIGSPSTITFGATFFMIGHIYKSFDKISIYKPTYVLPAIITFATSLFFYKDGLSIHCRHNEVLPYTLFATIGIYLTFAFSRLIDKYDIKKVFYCIGQETMIILSLHFLTFKIVSLILIGLYQLPISHLAEYPVLSINNMNYWFVYSIFGIIIPLAIKQKYNNLKYNTSWRK